MTSKRVLILEPSGNLWGSERVLLDFLTVASRSSWQISVCCPPDTAIVELLVKLPVRIFPTFVASLHKKKRIAYLKAIVGLLMATIQFRPCVIYVNQAGATRIALLISHLLHIPVITHVRLAEDAQYVLSMKAPEQDLPTVICISQFIQDLFAESELSSSKRLVLLYDLYTPRCDWALPVRLDCTSKTVTFSCVGRLAHTKGQDVVLHAINHLKVAGHHVHVKFLGTASPGDVFGQQLMELSNYLGISRQVSWLGFQNQVLSHLERQVALICPSRVEPLGRVIFEAWDAGTVPIAWSGSGGPAEVIQASNGGFLYEEQTGESLAKTLEQVLALSLEEREAIIQRGRLWLQANCNTAKYAERMFCLWQDTIDIP